MRASWFLYAALMAGGLSATVASRASAANPDARIRVILRGPATAASGAMVIRQPRIAKPAGGILPADAMPKSLAQTGQSLLAWVQASLTVDAGGVPGACHPNEITTMHGTTYRSEPADPALGQQACDMLRERVRFVHAIDEAGRPTAAVVEIGIQFEQGEARRPSAPPPPATLGPGLKRTSGHVTDATGNLLGQTWLATDYTLRQPDWGAVLTDRRKLPKAAMVGVLVDLRTRDGKDLVENCTIVRASGDARLDAATCAGLAAAGYDQSGGGRRWVNGFDHYPVRVDWVRDKATMTVLPPVEVPHMPKDGVLVAGDIPPGQRPPEERVQVDLQLAASGMPVRCEVVHSSGDDAWDAASCRVAKERARFTSPLDWFGTSSPGTYEAMVDWKQMVIQPRW